MEEGSIFCPNGEAGQSPKEAMNLNSPVSLLRNLPLFILCLLHVFFVLLCVPSLPVCCSSSGQDLPHCVNACAVLTLSKDMTFRDYAQGAFRMRGIGKGQRIRLFIVPEVAALIRTSLRISGTVSSTLQLGGVDPQRSKLVQSSWVFLPHSFLIHNYSRMLCLVDTHFDSMDKIQFRMLGVQSLQNVWRKRSYWRLLEQYGYFGLLMNCMFMKKQESLVIGSVLCFACDLLFLSTLFSFYFVSFA